MHAVLDSKQVRTYFLFGIWTKGLVSLTEVALGIIVLTVPREAIANTVIEFAQRELLEQPGDFLATYAIHAMQNFTLLNVAIIAAYLITRGLLKLGLVIALLKNQIWAYPAAVGVLGVFIVYQTYEAIHRLSPVIALLTVFDLFVVYFIWREYRLVRPQPVVS